MPRTFIAVLACLLLFGCSSPAQHAQALFDQGKYEEVVAQYPDTPIAQAARDTLAAWDRARHEFDGIIVEDPDTPYADDPNEKAAERIYNRQHYDSVLQVYPNTHAANMARNAIAEQLYKERKLDELIRKYPNTPDGWKARNEWALIEWSKITKLKGAARKTAIESFISDSTHVGTKPYAAAKAEHQNRLSEHYR
jgi:hypothetical protein